MSDHWNEANGGLRGSFFLRWGALAYALAAMVHFGARLLAPGAMGPENKYFLVALLVWDAALFLVAAGFLWTGINPILSRYGIAPGIFITLQAVILLLSLINTQALILPPAALTLGRTLLVGLFVLVERMHLSRGAILTLGLGPLLQFLRILLRIFGFMSPLAQPWEAILSAVFMLITAAGIYLVSRDVHRHEETWARASLPKRGARFAEFNNPLHGKSDSH